MDLITSRDVGIIGNYPNWGYGKFKYSAFDENNMVCEFLSVQYKKKLLEIAEIEQLVALGYKKKSAYNIRKSGAMTDEKCEKLVAMLGDKARPILLQALREFASQLNCQVNCS